jgi:hypothetical protein
MQSHLNNFIIHNSPIDGKGAFAARDIKKGEVICLLEGVSLSFADFEKMHAMGNRSISCDQLQIGVRTYILLEKPYVFINHSCNPNAGIAGIQQLMALRNISKGDEITYDYSATEWTVQDYPPYYIDGWPMNCRCGSPDCRKKIGRFPYLPKVIQEKYVMSGVIQDYILLRMKEPTGEQRCFICERYLQKKFIPSEIRR